ncbi:MAG: RNA pseudouridine synthase [Oligoflexales bacterium]|nr:RNA pseudouridine synthase [Oligoflexales bacterium]
MNIDFKPEIIFEDNHCLAAIKPPGISLAGDHRGETSFLDVIRGYYESSLAEGKKGYMVPVHFLDRPVSGIVIFAKSSKSARRLNEQFRSRAIGKTYIAVVEGGVEPEKGLLTDYLAKDRSRNMTVVSNKGDSEAKLCHLYYDVLERSDRGALLAIYPVTGRSHQIRVQLSSRGWPIAGDEKYGGTPFREKRIALHAAGLSFDHPTLKERVFLKSIPDPFWDAVWPLAREATRRFLDSKSSFPFEGKGKL